MDAGLLAQPEQPAVTNHLRQQEINMQTTEAAQRWATTWANAWPLKDVNAIVQLQADDGDHWASMFRRLRGPNGLRTYLEECFAEETQPAETWFSEPIVNGSSASVEYWVVMFIKDQPMTVSGCTVLSFDDSGLVTTARDYSHVKDGHHLRPELPFSA
ncbi:hypothetical protein CQ012_03525 [Arthrobacter sp. MYb214]|nr:hypothetical protein CQ016_03215 [Arthrobacter sp. MYb222]PRB78462.1 hypothetical protein CQ012_03525 [Arthrobacter sp. MYb214]